MGDLNKQIEQRVTAILAETYAETSGPVETTRILEAEARIGLKFPTDYLAFLSNYGAGYILDLNLFGLINSSQLPRDDGLVLFDIVEETLSFREESRVEGSAKRNFIYFGQDLSGREYKFFFDTSRESSEGIYFVTVQFGDGTFHDIAEDFLSFMEKMIASRSATFEFVDILYNRSAPPHDEPKKQHLKDSKAHNFAKLRHIHWLLITPDPCPPDLSLYAQYFGVDVDSGEIFIHAASAGITLAQQLDATSVGLAFFHDPLKSGVSQPLYVSIDFLVSQDPDSSDSSALIQLKKVLIDAFDQDRRP